MNKEASLVTSCAIATHDEEARENCRSVLVNNWINWERFLYYAVHHRVAPIVYRSLEELGLLKRLELQVLNTLKTIYLINQSRNNRLVSEVLAVLAELRDSGNTPLLVKGPALEIMAYKDIGLRTYEDIDLLVRREDAKITDEVLRSKGFVQGEYDPNTKSVKEASRKEVLSRSLNTHETSEYIKLLDDMLVRTVVVDVNFEVFWKGTKTYQKQNRIDTAVLFENSVDIPAGRSGTIRTLTPEFQVIQLSAHLFSEALLFFFHKNWYRDKHDLQLIKFLDVYMVCKTLDVDWEKLYGLCVDYDVLRPVFYTLHYVNELFPGSVPRSFIERGDGEMDEWLDAYMDKDGNVYQWDTKFDDRMFSMDKKIEEISSKFPSLSYASM